MNLLVVEREELLGDVPTQLLLGGGWVSAASGVTFPVDDPATSETLLEIADADEADALATLDAACEAQAEWAQTAPRLRAEFLRAAFEAVQRDRERLATLISLEVGKPLREALGEVDYGAEFQRWFSEEAVRARGDYRIAPDGITRILVERHG